MRLSMFLLSCPIEIKQKWQQSLFCESTNNIGRQKYHYQCKVEMLLDPSELFDYTNFTSPHAEVAELADAHDSKSCSFGSEGSIPSFGIQKIYIHKPEMLLLMVSLVFVFNSLFKNNFLEIIVGFREFRPIFA